MSDIWGLSTGENANDGKTEYEMPGGNLAVIPDGSKILAMVENAEWVSDDDDGTNEHLKLQWTGVKPENVQNRKVFQKLYITDLDPRATDAKKAEKKRDRARKMFAAIDANAGGKLAKKGGKPDADAIMFALANKPMVIRLGVWSLEDRDEPGRTIEGNWVQAVAPKTTEIGLTEPSEPKPQRSSGGRSQPRRDDADDDMDDDIPF